MSGNLAAPEKQSGRLAGSLRSLAQNSRDLGSAWHRNLHDDWWVSPACGLCVLVYVGAINLVLNALN